MSLLNSTAALDPLARQIDRSLRGGLNTQQSRISECQRALDYYQLRGSRWIERRDAESEVDYRLRPKLALPFTRRVVDLLCSLLYNPGPTRRFDDAEVGEWWDGVSRDNLLNSLWQRADRMATLHGVSAFQAAATGDPAKPIKVHLWTRDSFVPFEDPTDSSKLAAMVTIDRYDETTRYTWWSGDWIRVYQTKKLDYDQTNCGRTTTPTGPPEPNPYGVIPFSLVHHDLPTAGLDTPGLGCYLSEVNGTLDAEASDLAQAVKAYHTPLGLIYDGTADQQVIKKVGTFLRVNSASGDFADAKARLEYLQAQLDIVGAWGNIRFAVDAILEGLGVPESAYRLNQATLPSGAAQIAEQAPLRDYTSARQEPFRKYEADLITTARVVYENYQSRGVEGP